MNNLCVEVNIRELRQRVVSGLCGIILTLCVILSVLPVNEPYVGKAQVGVTRMR